MREVEKDWITEFLYVNQYSSVMNRTKWRELDEEMVLNPDLNLTARIKCIDESSAPTSFYRVDWGWVNSSNSRLIEWLEIDSTSRTRVGFLVEDQTADFSSWVRAALQKHSIPFSEEEGIFRINGYLKPNDK
jgi:hypothetical protein